MGSRLCSYCVGGKQCKCCDALVGDCFIQKDFTKEIEQIEVALRRSAVYVKKPWDKIKNFIKG